MPVSPTFEFKFYKNPDSEQCKNSINALVTYPVSNANVHLNGLAVKVTGSQYSVISPIVLNASEFIDYGQAQTPVTASWLTSVLYYYVDTPDLRNAVRQFTVSYPKTGIYKIEILLCSTINEPEYDYAVSLNYIAATGTLIQWISEDSQCFIVRMNNGNYKYFIRTGGAGTTFNLFTEVSSFDDIPTVAPNGFTQKSYKRFISFCSQEKSLNCSIQKFNDKIIDNIDAVGICKESDCECGNVKDVVKGWIITQFFYNFIQRHVSDDIVDIKYESLIAVDITDENENKVKDILNRYSALMCCKGSCSDC